MERQYLVNFLKDGKTHIGKTRKHDPRSLPLRNVQDSAAGFCVKDVRVTREMLAKQFIIIGGVVSGLFAALSRAI